MKNIFLSVCLLLFLFSSSLSFAQENVSMRLGDRGDSARLVFGWDITVDYKRIDISADILTIEFTKDANTKAVDISAVDISAFGYIKAIKTLSQSPLKVEISVVNGVSVRDFKIGKRVILDITKPENFEEPEKKSETKPPEPKDAKTSSPKKEKLADLKPIEKEVENKTMPAVPPAYVLVPEKLVKTPPKKEEAKKENSKLKKAVEQEEHVVSLRSTQNVDFAVFENFGKLWFIVDTQASYVIPELSTPKPALFSEPQRENLSDANAYSMSLPDEYMPIKATGGGLVWNVILGEKINEPAEIKPYREFSDARAGNGGKLIWPMKYLGKVFDIPDPITGQMLKIVTVKDAAQFSGAPKSYIDFDVLRSPVGLAIRPKVDDIIVEITTKGVEVYRPSGLDLASEKEIEAAQIYTNQRKEIQNKADHDDHADKSDEAHHDMPAHHDNAFFKFNQWQMASASDSLTHKKTVLLSTLNGKSDASKVEDLLTLGKMFLSYGRGAEALGFFDYASDELPELAESSEFIALRGMAKALDWKSESALSDLLNSKLDNENEVSYWRSYVLADLGDWQQAAKYLPKTFKEIYNYPNNISSRLALVLAEVALRDGRVKEADELITLVEHNKNELLDPFEAYLRYLKGESARQKGKSDNAKEIWKDLSTDKDDLYRTKAKLALTILKANEKEIDNDQKIDALERLRYAWRGDELEAQVKYWLGDAYFNKNDYLKGLHTMRDGAAVAAGTALGERIASEMSKAFSRLFLENNLKDVSSLDAVALYEEFSELTPLGEDGNKLVQVLAEHLVKDDLLPRASKIMKHQIDHRLAGEDKVRVAIRLAAIELMDKDPQGAVNALGKATNELKRISSEENKLRYVRNIALLKTRAYLQNKQYDKAITLLGGIPEGKDVNRLRADITWQAGYWSDAADAIRLVMIDENIMGDKPLTEDQADMLLNRAVALSLDNDRIALSNMRQKFIGAMKDTPKARQFEVITRPRKDGGLADRETLMSIVSEVDMFQEFLDDIRKGEDLPAAHN
ncbi:MAG: tetratricopeptide repeat protein [Alphaproteobacteria bacterium]